MNLLNSLMKILEGKPERNPGDPDNAIIDNILAKLGVKESKILETFRLETARPDKERMLGFIYNHMDSAYECPVMWGYTIFDEIDEKTLNGKKCMMGSLRPQVNTLGCARDEFKEIMINDGYEIYTRLR